MWDRCTVWLFCFAGSISISPSTLDRLQILHAIGYPHFNAYHSDTFYRAAVLYISIHTSIGQIISFQMMPPLRSFDDLDGKERGQKKTDDLRTMTTLGPRTYLPVLLVYGGRCVNL